MNRPILALALLSFLLLAPGAGARLTERCNPNFGVGEVLFWAATNVRAEIQGIVADPARNPDIFERLWQPKAVREILGDHLALKYDRIQDTTQIAREINDDPVLSARQLGHAWPNSEAGCFATAPPAIRVTVTEYYNRATGHYFMSGTEAENEIIDSGLAGLGWERTGEAFPTIAPGACHHSRPVFRFYGPRPNSHFFTPSTEECGLVRNADPGWIFEGEAFGAHLPANGVCPGRTMSVYRLYNNRAHLDDSNHRYVGRLELYEEMKAKGWIGEGLAMCLDSTGSEWWQPR